MHEYSIVQSLLARVDEEVRARDASAVHRLIVRIGELSGAEGELLGKAYSLLRHGTVCERAELCVEYVEARWVCSGCGRALSRGQLLSCSNCGLPARLEAGDEIILERIELEVP